MIEIREHKREYIHLTPFSSGSFFRMTGIVPTSLAIPHMTYKMPKRGSYVNWGKVYRERYLEEILDVLVFNSVSYNRFLKEYGFLLPYNMRTVYRDIESISLYLFSEHISSEKRYKEMISYDFMELNNVVRYMEACDLYYNEYSGGKHGIHYYNTIKVKGELERVISGNVHDGRFEYGDSFIERYGSSRGSIRNICSKLGITGVYDSEFPLGEQYKVKKESVVYVKSEYVHDDFDIDDYLEGSDCSSLYSSKWVDGFKNMNVNSMLIDC